MSEREYFPDGTLIDEWFYQAEAPALASLGRQYLLSDCGATDDGQVHTEKIQALIDHIAENGGGVLVVPKGTYLTGALFFKQGVHLYLAENAVLKGSDDISDYPVCATRIEGESCTYYPALINVENVDGFALFGKGTLDGNGLRSWKAFWKRREWNPNCTNKDEQRPRLVFISHSKNVTVCGLRMQNSPFWTNHIYKCERVRYIDCDIFSPHEPVPAPSTDGLDIDACTDVLVKHCRFEVSDDGIALKGGKGPWADSLPENGKNERVLIEDCSFGRCCAVLTCGSESIHNRNILVRRIKADGPWIVLWLKMRPDTPQRYEYITVEDVDAKVGNFLYVKPWEQFFDLKGRQDIPLSYADKITMRNCRFQGDCLLHVMQDKAQYLLSDILLEDITANVKTMALEENLEGIALKNVNM